LSARKDHCGRAFVVHGNIPHVPVDVTFFFFVVLPLDQYRGQYYGTVSCCQRSQTRVYARDLNEATYSEYLNPLTLITINSHRAIVHGRHCIFFSDRCFQTEFGQSISKVHTYILVDERKSLSSVPSTWQHFKWRYSANTRRYFRIRYHLCLLTIILYVHV